MTEAGRTGRRDTWGVYMWGWRAALPAGFPIGLGTYRPILGKRIERLYLLDFVRGWAALSVVVWHYQHFFYTAPSTLTPNFDRASQPFYALLWPFYEQGGRAVQIFFVLSGFVFFFHYAQAIRVRAVDARTFFILRFSRLYPLHFATLALVAVGQIASRFIDGQSIVYPCNTTPYLALNVFFVMHWLPANMICWSFNAPSWSVSVEVFLYAVFFFVALSLPRSWRGQLLTTAVVVATGVAVYALRGFHLVGEPVFCFFGGGLACLIWERSRAWPLCLAGGALGVLAITVLYLYFVGISEIAIGAALYPAAALLLAALQVLRPKLSRRATVLGDISYSVYLLHFPIQLGLLLLNKANLTHLDFSAPQVWFFFFSLLLCLSLITYKYFELPLQSGLRKQLLGTHLSRLNTAFGDAAPLSLQKQKRS